MAEIHDKGGVGRVITYVIVGLFTILAIYPIFWVILQSFKTTQEYMRESKLAFPKIWYVLNYPWAWKNGRFGMLILNSVFYTTITTMATIILSFMAGFAFAKIQSKATPILFGSFIIGILLTIQSIMVPLFLIINTIGLYDTRLGVLIPYVGIALPMAVYLSTEYIKSIPDAVLESARIDGAKYFEVFLKIVMPMAAPVAVTVAILQVTGTWNEFMLINILVSREDLRSLPVGVARFSGPLASDYGRQFSALVIGMMPMVIFYAIFRKQITKGVAAGAVKG